MIDPKKAAKAASKALMLIEQHGLEASPANVMAWYAYAARLDEDWNARLDQYMASRDKLGPEKQDEIICHFILGLVECRKMVQGIAGLSSAMGTVVARLAEAEGEASDFGRELKSTAKNLEAAKNIDEAKGTLSQAVGMIEHISERQRELARALRETSEEVILLRDRLAQVHREAITDDLTDLSNRRYFDARLRELTEEAGQTGQPLALALIDVDHFKRFNDEHGHQVGDNVLKLVAGIIKRATRGSDVAARIGGEEFGLVLHRTDLSDAVALAERIRSTLHSRELVKRGAAQALGRITVSIGVAAFQPGLTVEKLFDEADRALYAAKRTGRNRVVAKDGNGMPPTGEAE